MPIKTFRGRIKEPGEQKIRLSTQNGMRGYRIHSLAVMPKTPGATSDVECVVKLYRRSPDAIDSEVDFTDANLLAVVYYQDESTQHNPTSMDVIFDREIFNQDIFITNHANAGSQDMNYHLELEEVALNKNSQSVVTLKDIRSNIA